MCTLEQVAAEQEHTALEPGDSEGESTEARHTLQEKRQVHFKLIYLNTWF